MVETVNGVSKTYSYTYDTDNSLISMSVGDTTVSYTYDDFGRVSKRTTKHGETVMESITPGYYETENTTSSQIVSYNGYTYTYDGNGNITYYGDGRRDENFFQYDSQNQMIRAESYDLGYIWIWEYDNAGNILSRTMYDFFDTGLVTPLETVSYEYNDSEWGDLLTSYDGRTITYDVIGNPLSDGQWTYTWQHGRQLTSMSNGSTTWTFTYNADGMRTSRTDGEYVYSYVYNGSQLTQMTVDGYTQYFAYDSNGTPLSLIIGGYHYYYVTNLQGDVIGILDEDGNQVVTYIYDAWGNVTCYGDDLVADYNPLLYRGYVYDWETGLYYVGSRYYDPEIGRWINADNQLSTGSDLTGMNLFAYCGNNPVNRIDPTGEAWWHWALGAAVVAVAAVATVVTCGGFAAAATAVCMVGSGVAAATTASTVAAGAFIGSATVYGMAVLSAASTSNSVQEFNDQGNWGTVAATAFGGLTGGYDGYTMSKAQTPTSTPTGKGTQNPKVKAAVQKGQAMHKQMDYGPGVLKEQTIAPGCRVDGIDFNNRIIYELKPNNPQAIARGMSQLNRYTSAASQQFGGTWTGVLKLYD